MKRTPPILRNLIASSQLKQRCQSSLFLQSIRRPSRQISTKPPPDDLSNLSPINNLHAARDEFARKRRRLLLPTVSIGLIAAGYYLYSTQTSNNNNNTFDPPRFTPFTIVLHEDISSTGFILTLRPSKAVLQEDTYKEEWEQGIWSVEVKQPLLQIARSYTPLPPSPSLQNNGELRFLIRKERGGEVSNYLAKLPVGGKVELRGPHRGFDLSGDVKEVLFLAGGTGIAPALQVVHTLLERRSERPRICVVWANRKREDCIGGANAKDLPRGSKNAIVEQLEELREKYPENLRVEYLVDEEGTLLDQKKISALTSNGGEVKYGPRHSRIDERLLLVSGPEGFVTYLAGAKKWEGGIEAQGEVGGIIGRLGVRRWKVWKL